MKYTKLVFLILLLVTCQSKNNAKTKDKIVLTFIVDSPLDYIEKKENKYLLSNEFVEFLLPFENKDLELKVIPNIVIAQIGSTEIIDFSNENDNLLGIKPKIEKLNEKLKVKYSEFDVPQTFNNIQLDTSYSLKEIQKIISPSQEKDSIILFHFKGNSFDVLQESNFISQKIKDSDSFHNTLSELLIQYPTFKIFVLFKIDLKKIIKEEKIIKVVKKTQRDSKTTLKNKKKEKLGKAQDIQQQQIGVKSDLERYKRIKKLLSGGKAKKYEEKILRAEAELNELNEILKDLEEEINTLNGQLGLANETIKKAAIENNALKNEIDSSNQNSNLTKYENKRLKIQLIQNEISTLIEKGKRATELVSLDETGEIIIYKIDKNGDKIQVKGLPGLGIPKNTYNEHRKDVKNAICEYFYLARQRAVQNNLELAEIQIETEKLRGIYYKLCKKSYVQENYFDNYIDFLNACK